MFFYTGIGSRKTPTDVLYVFKSFGKSLSSYMTLRSGGADGADKAFEDGCDIVNGNKEIYLPWKGFNNSNSSLFHIPIEAFEAAADVYGPAWKYLKQPVKNLMARNMQQVSGYSLDIPTEFIFCWTPDGCLSKTTRTKETGGTGQAIAYAYELNIPIFNFYNNTFDELSDFFQNNAIKYGIKNELA